MWYNIVHFNASNSCLQNMCGAYVYLLFMCMALIAFTYTMFRLPETKGRTFDDIVAEFRGAEGIPLHNKTTFNTFPWSGSAFGLTNSDQLKCNWCVYKTNEEY